MTKINDKQPNHMFSLTNRLSISLSQDTDNRNSISIFSNRTGGYFYNSLNMGSFDYVDKEKLKGLADFINNYLEKNND